MVKTILVLFVYIFTTILTHGTLSQKCFENSEQIHCKLGSKTPYRFIANYNDSRYIYTGCSEKKMWLVVRHGTRYPGKKHVKPMIKKLPKLKKKIVQSNNQNNSELSHDTIEKFNKWTLSFDEKQTMILANEGENELIDLAERMQSRFPNILVDNYDPELYKFKYTATQRTEKSAQSFVLGLFGQYHSANITFPKPEQKDPILRFYKRCERWRTEIDKNPETYKEKELFIKSETFQKVVSDISQRLGLKLDYESVNLIYLICAFETAWNKTGKSPWCDTLSLDNMKVLEFMEDLEYYWVDGYGHQLNYNQACPALRDMFTFFDSNDKSLVTAYFTHSGTILKMLSILGIGKETNPLTHESFLSHKDRNWKVSLIDAFASNIAFVLYDVIFAVVKYKVQVSLCYIKNGQFKFLVVHRKHCVLYQ
ncbi:multiple inositol polyphosphate phosphatase 1 isoform X2 [Nasonia vitripennis]|uniref:Multiple inositol polyphosphate phosphatase 1 n=1 Tax=Nasonia vitripennis TaxID=7425 RepID=A0A7M7Q411_NASVI|nr:multiple inositol polyphosphate phosphatase 1 isoform X2 [Nasonia vitripennis]